MQRGERYEQRVSRQRTVVDAASNALDEQQRGGRCEDRVGISMQRCGRCLQTRWLSAAAWWTLPTLCEAAKT